MQLRNGASTVKPAQVYYGHRLLRVIVLLDGRDSSDLGRVRESVRTPFLSTMRVSGNQLFLVVRLQLSHLSPVPTSLFASLKQMNICCLDHIHSWVY